MAQAPKKKRNRYDDKFRASAVVMLEAAGYPSREGALTHAAKELGIPRQTLQRWGRGSQNPPPPELVTEKRADMKTLIENEIYSALHSMGDAREFAEYRELGTVIGILVDKLQLLKGEPTSRTHVEGKITWAEAVKQAAMPQPQYGDAREELVQ